MDHNELKEKLKSIADEWIYKIAANEKFQYALATINQEDVEAVYGAWMLIQNQEKEITRLRKRDVELTQTLEDSIQELEKTKAELEELHAVYNKTVNGIRKLMDKINK